MNIFYRLAAFLLSPFPRRWNNRDTQGAVLIMLALTFLVWLLSGCYGMAVYADLEHHSSAPDIDDAAETNGLGPCLDWPLADHRYAPEMSACLHWELRGESPYGHDPIGTVRLRQPIYKSRP